MSEDWVLTPGGYRSKSLVHLVEPGNILNASDDRLRMLRPSGETVADLGVIAPSGGRAPFMPTNVAHAPGGVTGLFEGWIAYAGWENQTGRPISWFSTRWTVPPAPATYSGQTIFLFNGIQNSDQIYQPVLQWGGSAAGGGEYWAVASWYVGTAAAHSPLIQVSAGDTLVGAMKLTDQSEGAFDYFCEFEGLADSGFPVQQIPELTWCCEVLEAYHIEHCSDYPGTSYTAMTSINVQTQDGHPPLEWTPVRETGDCGQDAVVVSNSSDGGEVHLYY